MKRYIFAAVAIATTVCFASPAAASVCVGISTNGGTTITNVGCDNAGAGKESYVASNLGYSFDVGGTGFPLVSMPDLLTQTLDIRQEGSGSQTIDIFVTQTGLTAYTGGLLSTFTSNTVTGVSATVRSYFDTTNAQFGLANLLQTGSFTGPGVVSGSNALSTGGLWSETVRYTLNFTGGQGSRFNGTANLAAVPEPATWAMMLLGFGGIGFAMRRRRQPTLAQVA